MSAPVERQGDDLVFGASQTLFEQRFQTFGGTAFNATTRYDVSKDGRIVALLRATEEPPPPLTLVFHWAEAFRRR